MTEAKWLTCMDPTPMLGYLRDKGGSRKLRLFACICCRRIWYMLTDIRTQQAVKVAEAFADSLTSQRERRTSCAEVRSYADDFAPDEAVAAAIHRLPFFAAVEASRWSASACGAAADADWPGLNHIEVGQRERVQERTRQAALLREFFGNPFRLVSLSAAFLTWNEALVVRLAQTAYAERKMPEGILDNVRLAILADALEESGCADADILNHLRSPGPHVRGCWAVDLCLGKA